MSAIQSLTLSAERLSLKFSTIERVNLDKLVDHISHKNHENRSECSDTDYLSQE